MKKAFEEVLRDQLRLIRENADQDPVELYEVLLDMYNIEGIREDLQGILTTNYDEYIEIAVERVSSLAADFGVQVQQLPGTTRGIRLLKLHGSFGWQDTWPISTGDDGKRTLWIPPGIQKAKQSYPFNIVWGLAREMLSCDILRVIGCRLSANDWDLISLLFNMCHVHLEARPHIEVIDSPMHAEQLKSSYPYLRIRSLLELEEIGSRFIAEFSGGSQREFIDLTEEEQNQVIESAGRTKNWFELWLRQKIESLHIELGSVATEARTVEEFLEAG